jgi:glutathione synthase/RimK-type ligase-like ATP-grasp enzyme
MLAHVEEALAAARQEYLWIDTALMPGHWRLDLRPGRVLIRHQDGRTVDLQSVRSIYHRLGFSAFEHAPDYEPADIQHVDNACMAALSPVLDRLPGRVVNRPRAAASNASKPLQAMLLAEAGFGVPETIVTNVPDQVVAFYQRHGGNLIYKSISHLRSIVQRMNDDDLGRLDTLQACPAQFQERVEGVDVRVHVVDEQVFASQIQTEKADYRYDKQVDIRAVDLEPWLAAACVGLAQKLGLVLAGIDLRITPDGRPYCFEANPSPVFSWYEDRTGQPIAAALAGLLAR